MKTPAKSDKKNNNLIIGSQRIYNKDGEEVVYEGWVFNQEDRIGLYWGTNNLLQKNGTSKLSLKIKQLNE